MANDQKPVISVRKLRKVYMMGQEHVVALHNIDLDIPRGEVCCIFGTSGSGKSTLLNQLAGLEKPTRGVVRIGGVPISQLNENQLAAFRQKHIGFVFQSYNLLPELTAAENVAMPLMFKGIDPDVRLLEAKKMLCRVGLKDRMDHFPNQMSGGQQQRIAIARSLLLKPSLLLLDEPFSALDAKIRQQMREELKKIQSDLGITVVFVTHDQEEAMSLSHRIVVMNKGKFEQIGTPTEIYDKPATRHVASFIGEMNFIDKDNKTIAVRPEDVTVSIDGSGDFTGTVRTIMVLGHYVVVNVQHGDNVIKCFVDRDISEKLSVGQTVGMHIGKHTIFDK